MRGDAVERRRKVAAVDLLGLENDSKTEELAAAATASICDGQKLRVDKILVLLSWRGSVLRGRGWRR